jgi:hypothetical protein
VTGLQERLRQNGFKRLEQAVGTANQSSK